MALDKFNKDIRICIIMLKRKMDALNLDPTYVRILNKVEFGFSRPIFDRYPNCKFSEKIVHDFYGIELMSEDVKYIVENSRKILIPELCLINPSRPDYHIGYQNVSGSDFSKIYLDLIYGRSYL